MPAFVRPAPLAAALAAALLLPLSAHAALTADEEAAARERKSTVLDTVEVHGEAVEGYDAKRSTTATRTDTPLIDTPQAITVVTQELIRDQAMQNLADVVRYVPGIGFAQGEGNRDTPVFRGNSSTADMFIDGMRDDVQYFRDLYNIDRVEALKGPNAMIFGRGGSGGLLNRVSKQPDWNTIRAVGLQWGTWGKKRATADFGGAISERAAFRVAALAEDSGSFRDDYEARRFGINPTLAVDFGAHTTVVAGVEHFEDERTADRGISSYLGRPVDVDPSTFFGDPNRSEATVDVDAFNLSVDHDFANGVNLRNRTRYGTYDKFYQNVFPGAVLGNGSQVTISAYNNATQRDSVFNQTDVTWTMASGSVKHTLLAGMELGRQETDNLRETGYFAASDCSASGSGVTTSVTVPLDNPRYEGPLCFRPSASDANNHSVARAAAVYVQDQIEFSPKWQAIVGLRYDRFEVDLRNNRTAVELDSKDNLLSPRFGLVYKPQENMSVYGSYSVAFLPRSGEQLASLAVTTAALDPEEFTNTELGLKWDIRPNLSLTAALYQLDRSNVAVVDELNPSQMVLLAGDSQRVRGVEVGLSGRLTENWSVMGGYAYQDGVITRDIKTGTLPNQIIREGTVLAQVPEHSFSLWNRYDFNERWGVGLGFVSRSEVFTSTSNAVTLHGFGRFDGAVFFRLSDSVQMQLNIENLMDKQYYSNAHSDTNISPGSPRAFNLGINLAF